MKEYPIIFSGPMVQAIFDDRKTQTRRVLKPQPIAVIERNTGEWDCNERHVQGIRMYHDWPHEVVRTQDQGDRLAAIRCPYGKPGDQLWVRETWRFLGPDRRAGVFQYRADGHRRTINRPWRDIEYYMTGFADRRMWRPSIHMPRWASRTLLEVTDVRVERVQDISIADITAEGITSTDKYLEWEEHVNAVAPPGSVRQTDREWFAQYWDFLNAKKGHSWDANPLVWVITFKRLPD